MSHWKRIVSTLAITTVLFFGPRFSLADEVLAMAANPVPEAEAGQVTEPLAVASDTAVSEPDAASLEPEVSSTQAPTVSTSRLPAIGYVPEEAHFKLEARGPNPATEPYRNALRAESTGNWEQALEYAQAALSMDANHAAVRLALGRLLVKMRKYESATAELSALTRSAQGDWQSWFWLGTAQLMQQQLDAATASLDEALRRNGKVAEVWIQRALIEQQRGDYLTALQLLGIANDLAPEHPGVLLNVAYCSEAIGNLTAAQTAYRKFLSRAGQGGIDTPTRVVVLRHLTDLSNGGDRSAPPDIADAN